PNEIKSYIEHRLRIAGNVGRPLFTAGAYEQVAKASQGIPRNVNNFCFNALSLTCALRKRTVDAQVVNEVTADLDIEKLASLSSPQNTLATEVEVRVEGQRQTSVMCTQEQHIFTPAEAAAYMQQVASKLRSWQKSPF